jgi:microcystin-dependent protein
VIGTLYGAGDGSTTFNLPDLQGRVAAGWAASGGHSDVSTLGLTDGTSTLANRRPRHKHTVVQPSISKPGVTISDPGHSHSLGGKNSGAGTVGNVHADQSGVGEWLSGLITSVATGISAALASIPVASGGTVGPQTGAEPTDAPSYLVVNHIIKT